MNSSKKYPSSQWLKKPVGRLALRVIFFVNQELASEAEIFLSMDHPHVVRLFDVYEDEQLQLSYGC